MAEHRFSVSVQLTRVSWHLNPGDRVHRVSWWLSCKSSGLQLGAGAGIQALASRIVAAGATAELPPGWFPSGDSGGAGCTYGQKVGTMAACGCCCGRPGGPAVPAGPWPVCAGPGRGVPTAPALAGGVMYKTRTQGNAPGIKREHYPRY